MSENSSEAIVNQPKFSWRRIGKIVGVIVILAGIFSAGYFFFTRRPVKIALISLIADNIEHGLPCEELPFFTEVKKSLAQHADVVDKIKQIDPSVSVSEQEIKCYNSDGSFYFPKGDIVIEYAAHGQRVKIQKLIGDNFFGIPYRGRNY